MALKNDKIGFLSSSNLPKIQGYSVDMVDVAWEMEWRAEWAKLASVTHYAHSAHYSISCVTSTIFTLYIKDISNLTTPTPAPCQCVSPRSSTRITRVTFGVPLMAANYWAGASRAGRQAGQMGRHGAF